MNWLMVRHIEASVSVDGDEVVGCYVRPVEGLQYVCARESGLIGHVVGGSLGGILQIDQYLLSWW